MINIAELLKDAPRDLKLYSPICGHCKLSCILYDDGIRVIAHDVPFRFDKYGRFCSADDAECLLFPSKGRTWEGWKLPVEPKFKVGDWITSIDDEGDTAVERIVNLRDNKVLLVDIDGCFTEYPRGTLESYRLWTIADAKDGDVITNGKMIVIFNKLEEPTYKQHIIAYVGLDLCGRLQITEDIWQLGVDNAMPATKEQRDLLFKKMKEAGYQWDADKKELKKIKPHYDIANFKPKQWVLVRQGDGLAWRLDIFSHLKEGVVCQFECVGNSMVQCIPFEGNEHLLGTTDMCDEQYINW